MAERPSEMNSNLASLLAGFEVELDCAVIVDSGLDVECTMTEAEVADAFASIPEVSVESMKSICEGLVG
jgi:hypothetical protein